MVLFDYSREPRSDIAFVDMKSFYASCECIALGLDPLKTSLCVMSRVENSSGLILAATPLFKKNFGSQNVSRSYNLPFDVHTRKFNYAAAHKQGLPITADYVRFIEDAAQKTLLVPPRMNYYIQKNMEIQKIFQDFAAPDDIFPYSIDEGFLDLTSSINYFIPDQTLDRRTKLDLLAARIQQAIWKKTGIYASIGLSNANPLLAKLALDIEAKHTKKMRVNWSYEDVPRKVWTIPTMTDFWGIGHRTATRLKKLGIHSIYDLAHFNPDILKKEMGVLGLQLWFHAHGIDESNVHKPYQVKSHGLGNSQILPEIIDSRQRLSWFSEKWLSKSPFGSDALVRNVSVSPSMPVIPSRSSCLPFIHRKKLSPLTTAIDWLKSSFSSFVPNIRAGLSDRLAFFTVTLSIKDMV